MQSGQPKKLITYEELVKHITRSDCWVSVEGKVMNVTKFLAEHPGGEDILLANWYRCYKIFSKHCWW